MPRPRPGLVLLVLGVYVVPLTAAVVFLVATGLPVLALALLVVEATVAGAVVLARRAPPD